MGNVFFDTCVYHQPGVDLLFEVIERKNILFGSEMLGAVRGIDPETGHHFDDTKRYVDAAGAHADETRRGLSRATPVGSIPASTRRCGRGPRSWRPSRWTRTGWSSIPTPSRPTFTLPAGSVDAHCHVFGPGDVFPFADERKYTPV